MHNILYKVTLVEGAKYIFLLFLVSLLLPDPYKMQRGNFKVLSFPQNPEGRGRVPLEKWSLSQFGTLQFAGNLCMQ